MKNVYIFCEGQTEEAFINDILYQYFFNIGIAVYPIICTTKRTPNGKHRGGVQRNGGYSKIKKELIMICKQHRNEYVTTMFDYYGMPDDTPGINIDGTDIENRTKHIEAIIDSDINASNCKFHLMLHEFEGLLFSDPGSFRLITDEPTVEQIQAIRGSFINPEHINNSRETAPSKRLLSLIPNYSKTRNGILLAKNMGIDIMMKQCPHFNEWIKLIASMCKVGEDD